MSHYRTVLDLVGNTPLVELVNYERKNGLHATLLAKLEYLNPAGSVKDRIAKAMIEQAEKSGALKAGATVIEPTSGNTGIGLAAVAAAKGYKLIVTMPDTMSAERIALLKAYGAQVVLTAGAEGMNGAIAKAKELAAAIDGSFVPDQFANPVNPSVHTATTGPEIWNDTDGKVDIFVAGVGSGGTLSGAGGFLKSKNANISVVAVEPAASPTLSLGVAGAHKIQGIGAGFIPDTLDVDIIDEVETVESAAAFAACKDVALCDGVLAGISSGAALWAATEIAKRRQNYGKTVVVIFPDGGQRYLSSGLFD